MRLAYEVTGSGWATVLIECDGQRVEIVASYLSDCLRDLARAAFNLCRGSSVEAVDFLDEPGEHRLVMRRVDDTRVECRVSWYEGWLSVHPSLEPVEQKLHCVTTVAHVRGQVYSAMGKLLETLGSDGYKERWVNHPFPADEYEALRRAVA